MQALSDEKIKAHVLFKLYWRRCWGGKHTAAESVKKGVPKHLAGAYLEAVKQLVRDGLLLSKPTHYGLQISLNPGRRGEITKTAEEFAKNKTQLSTI